MLICSPRVFLCPRLLRAAILPLKHFYGIKMQVWGSEQLNIKEPYVIVCNHQASLDLMGTCKGEGGSSLHGQPLGCCRGGPGSPWGVPARPAPGFVQGSVVGIGQKSWWDRSSGLWVCCGERVGTTEDDARSLQPQGWLVLGAVGQGRILSSPIHPPGMVEVIPDRCVPIAKKELMYLGTVGWACWLSGIIFIDRHKRQDAIDVISQTARTMRHENVRGGLAAGGSGGANADGTRGMWGRWT